MAFIVYQVQGHQDKIVGDNDVDIASTSLLRM